ncbi:polysaccharide export outer membrane protein [Marisediminitalea aggregata]|uniref:Polysaccharide export outer membrane protein n=1 Tax=Marisediminitalea aggregata TaxID=634436 RepID=A0A1M5HF73_9ALTE|nr:polysaccharide biosynthesis/export family protein [Marisediminitalea aggregata]SHG14571.1 polysaccharide export outer membrane protein [Marisediminitalea aggregata]
MNIKFSHPLSLLVFLITFLTSQSNAQELSDYRLSSDDVISVSVFDEPDLSLKETRISSAGTIAMPLIGQISVKGLTIVEAEKEIARLYRGDYLKNPDINITIVEYRQFYVNGEVEKPGGYSYREGMTVQRAITLAGGFTERASRSKIYIIREGYDNKQLNVSLTTTVNPGDVITVEESFF